MRSPSSRTRPLLHTLAACLSLCLLACESGPPTGQCTGSIGGTSVEGLVIDEGSEYHHRYGTSCADATPAVYNFSYGKGALKIAGLSTRAVSLLDGQMTCALPPATDATFMVAWQVLAPGTHPVVRTGTATLEFKVGGRLLGKFRMEHEDATAAECTFDIPIGDDEGNRPDCGDHDDDDWD